MAVFLGSLIGFERRSNDRPAGIRTMALVSLGSALFTINSTFAFINGPMSWDSSRVSAAIPSGVGFLGGGLIVKSSEKDPNTGERHHLVQGITTAAATWLSAAVGIACGGGMYFVACFSTALNLLILRFGPRVQENEGSESSEDGDPQDLEFGKVETTDKPFYGGAVASPRRDEVMPLKSSSARAVRRGSISSRPSLMS